MNHNKKYEEQNLTTNGNNNTREHTCGNFELSASDIWDNFVSDDDDDDNTPIKQDYDLDNLYGRERHEIEEQTDTLSEDDDIEDMDTHNQVLIDTMKTSRTSNRTQSIEEEHALSQKLSQLSTSSNNHQGKSSSSNEDFEKLPNYLTKSNKSFENMLNSTLSVNAIKMSNLEAYRQIAIFIHQIKYNEILYSLWTVYIKSGLGKLKTQDSQDPIGPQVWPAPVKSMVKVNVRSGVKEHDACLAYVQKRLLELETAIKQAQHNLHNQTNRLPNYSSIVQQAIETFVEENLTGLRNKIEYKIQLVHYDYDERILELQYLQHNPTEAQIQLANQRCITRQQHETTKHELQLLEKRINQHNSSSFSPSFDTLSISRVPLFDSINNIEVRQQLNIQYRQMIEQSKMDLFKLYISSATTQMQYYQRLHKDEIKQMRKDQLSLPDDQKLSRVMIDLIEQRANMISERIKYTYHFKAQTLSV